MGDLREPDDQEQIYTMDEVRKHTKPDDAWIVIDDVIYDITNFWKKHPGGQNVIMAFAGMDASAMYHLYHLRKEKSNKYLRIYEKGKVKPDSISERNRQIDKDFTELTELMEKKGFFKSNYIMEALVMLHVPLLLMLSMAVISYLGNGWGSTLLSALVLGWGFCQSLYVFHDFGHRAVTHNVTIDYFFQHVYTNVTLGFCTEFTQIYHNLHHTFPHKTGAVLKNEEASKVKREKLAIWRIIYNACTTAPALFPILWSIGSIKLSIQNRRWMNLFTVSIHYAWYIGYFYPHLGLLGILVHWTVARQFWSHVVFLTALANHIKFPEEFEDMPFFEYQVASTVNFEGSYLQDYLTGGQSEQIEHHLWPHMPRENLRKTVPYVKALCKKWDIEYICKKPLKAYGDVFVKLRSQAGASRPYDIWCQMMYRTK